MPCLVRQLFLALVAILGLGQMIAACGQKGPLYLPQKEGQAANKAAKEAPASPAGTPKSPGTPGLETPAPAIPGPEAMPPPIR